MKALTVSSEGNLVLKVGAGAPDCFAAEDFSWAIPSIDSRRTSEQQKARRCMTSFPKNQFCKTSSVTRLQDLNQRHRRRTGVSAPHRYEPVLAAMGKRRPEPKAFGEIFSPGAACWRLYSARSTIWITFC